MSQLPEVRINFSWLFYEDISKKIAKTQSWELPSGEQCEEWVEAYRKSWAKKESKILTALQDITGLKFYKSVIDITAAPGVTPKSEPLLIGFNNTPESVLDTITHELTHTLLCDNKSLSIYGENRDFQLGSEWRNLFGFEDDFDALVHVPVYAVNKALFEDVLADKDYINRERKQMESFGATAYIKAIDYVEAEGADTVIQKLKNSYAGIAKKLEKES